MQTGSHVDYSPHTDADVRAMLAVLDLPDLDALFAQVPAALRAPFDLGLSAGVSEAEVLNELRRLAGRNRTVEDAVCFLGGGAYDHYQPALVSAVTSRAEFSTAYTPYQPEMSQGGLQALFEFQTLASEILGLPVANCGLYDGATALVEGMIMCLGATGRRRVALAGTLDPRYRTTLATYAPGLGVGLDEVSATEGRTDPANLGSMGEGVAALVVQHPNCLGILEDVPALAAAAHRGGARLLVSFDGMLAGVLEPPGRLGADVVVADGLSLGNGLQFGGPGVGLLACGLDDLRRLPGRLVGETVDVDGRRGYVLTLQAREQHIRRDKATSNICTNQSLNALASAVYLSWLGPQGLVELGKACLAGAAYAADQLSDLLAYPHAVTGKEFALRLPDPAGMARQLADGCYLLGPVIRVAGEDLLLVAVTEQRTRAEIDGLVRAIRDLAAAEAPAAAVA